MSVIALPITRAILDTAGSVVRSRHDRCLSTIFRGLNVNPPFSTVVKDIIKKSKFGVAHIRGRSCKHRILTTLGKARQETLTHARHR